MQRKRERVAWLAETDVFVQGRVLPDEAGRGRHRKRQGQGIDAPERIRRRGTAGAIMRRG